MAGHPPHITAAELGIMKILWELGSASVGDVRGRITRPGGDAPAYTTVMTLMNQLAAKGALRVDRERQPFVYEPAVRRDTVLRERVRQFVKNVFDGRSGELVLRLVEQTDISPEDLKRIEDKIEARGRDESPSRPAPRRGRGER